MCARYALVLSRRGDLCSPANNVIKNNKYSVDSKFLQADALLDKKEYKEAVDFLREFYCDPVDKDTEKRIEEKIILASILYSQVLRSEKNMLRQLML